MKAIRPIYDGKDDLDDRDEIDATDMLVCFLSELNDHFDELKEISEEQVYEIRTLVDQEMLSPGTIKTDLGILDNDDLYDPEYYDSYDGLIVMYEIKRWMEECGYDWDIIADHRFKYHSMLLGMIDADGSTNKSGQFVLNTTKKAFNELKKLLTIHWAVELLDWYPFIISGIDNKEMIEFGNLMIACI